MATPPILLVHGLWMTPKSWDPWVQMYRDLGHDVVVPAWPGIGDRTPAEVRADPSALRGIGLGAVIDSIAEVAAGLPVRPIIMGHSFGGLITQVLADRGLGSAYVGVAPGQPAGIPVLPLSTFRSGLPVLGNPFGINAASQIGKGHFHYTFGNDLTREASDVIWEEQAIPSYNRLFFEGVAGAVTGRGASRVDFGKADRAPLLVVAGTRDHVVPPSIARAVVRRYQSKGTALVEYREYEGRTHRLVSQDGWEEIASTALDWALEHRAG